MPYFKFNLKFRIKTKMCCYHRMTQAHMGQDEKKNGLFGMLPPTGGKLKPLTLTGNDLLG